MRNKIKILLFIIAFSSIPSVGFSQKDSIFSRWTIGVGSALDNYNFKFNTTLIAFGWPNTPLYCRNTWNRSSGILGTYNFSKRIFLKFGEQVSSISYLEEYYDESFLENYYTLRNAYYLQVPIELGINLFIKRGFRISTINGFKTGTSILQNSAFDSFYQEWANSSISFEILPTKYLDLSFSPYIQYDLIQFDSAYEIWKNSIAYGMCAEIGYDF